MEIQLKIELNQLIAIIKKLPVAQLKQLKEVIEKEVTPEEPGSDLEKLLLNGPTATDKQIETILNNRKSINKWRIK